MRLGVEIEYDPEVTDLVIDDGMFLAARLKLARSRAEAGIRCERRLVAGPAVEGQLDG